MANRDPGARVGSGLEGIVRQLLRRIDVLEAKVRKLEAQGGGMLPADFRFDREVVGGGYAVVIRRVSTDEAEQITGPL